MLIGKLFPIAATCVVAAAGSFAMSAPNAFADFTSTSSITNNEISAGNLDVRIVDTNGQTLSSPIVSVQNAAPAMATQIFTVRISNQGSLAAATSLHSADLVAVSNADLNDVLQIKVVDASSNVLYVGKIADLEIIFEQIAVNSTKVLSLEITWPDLPAVDDNPYQDASLTFSLVADASNLIA